MGCADCGVVIDNDNNKFNGVDYIPNHDALISSNLKFPDFEEIPTGPYLGLKVKKILNYKCNITYDELENLRDKFWLSRDKQDNVWSILKLCCEVDGEDAEKILKIHGQITLKKDMRKTYSKFHPNYIYNVPNYCIADPIYVRNYNLYEKVYESTEDNILNLNLFYFNDKKTYAIRITNKCTGFDLKRKFAKRMNIDMKLNKIRLFCKGQEILDTHCCYFHELDEHSRIVIMSCQLINKYIKSD